MTLREVMNIREASEYLGIAPDTLYKYASEGTIPAFKLGNRWRFKLTLLNEWMDQKASANVRKSDHENYFSPLKVPDSGASK